LRLLREFRFSTVKRILAAVQPEAAGAPTALRLAGR
jgi:hypothetical protein